MKKLIFALGVVSLMFSCNEPTVPVKPTNIVTGNCVVIDAPKRDGEVLTGEKVYFTNIVEKNNK
jgi:hypothetical protein